MKTYILVFSISLLISCNITSEKDSLVQAEPTESLHPKLKKIMGNSDHFFRGYHFEDAYQHILKTEIANLVKESKTLYFEDDFNENEFYDLEYYFTAERQLKAIKIDVYLTNKEEGRKLAYEIKDFLTNKFNQINSQQEYGYLVSVNIYIAPREKDAGFVLIISRPENLKK